MSKLRRTPGPLPEVMQTASQLGCRSVRMVTQWPGRPSPPAGRDAYTFIFLHFWTIYFAERRHWTTASGVARKFPGRPAMHSC